MRKKVWMLFMSAMMVFSLTACGEKEEKSSAFDDVSKKKESVVETKEETEESETVEETKETEETEEVFVANPVTTLSKEDVVNYLYSNGYSEDYDMTEVAEVSVFGSIMDYILEDYYWYNSLTGEEVMYVLFTDEESANTFYLNYYGATISDKYYVEDHTDTKYVVGYYGDASLYIDAAQIGNAFFFTAGMENDKEKVLETYNQILGTSIETDFQSIVENTGADLEVYVRVIGNMSLSFTFKEGWVVDDSNSDSLIVTVDDSTSAMYYDSQITVGDETAVKDCMIVFDESYSVPINGRDSYVAVTSYDTYRSISVLENIGGTNYLQIDILTEDMEVDLADILSAMCMNV